MEMEVTPKNLKHPSTSLEHHDVERTTASSQLGCWMLTVAVCLWASTIGVSLNRVIQKLVLFVIAGPKPPTLRVCLVFWGTAPWLVLKENQGETRHFEVPPHFSDTFMGLPFSFGGGVGLKEHLRLHSLFFAGGGGPMKQRDTHRKHVPLPRDRRDSPRWP